MTAPTLPRVGKIDQNQFQPNLPARDSLVLISKSGVIVGQERQINLIAGANVTLTVIDDPANGQVTITIDAAAGGYVSGNLHVTGSLIVDTSTETNDLSGTTTIQGQLSVEDATTINGPTVITDALTVDGATIMNAPLTVHGTTTLVGDLDVTGGDLVVSAGEVKTLASSTFSSGLNVPHGAAPTAPVNGDFWSTTAGFFGRVNGVTVGPFT